MTNEEVLKKLLKEATLKLDDKTLDASGNLKNIDLNSLYQKLFELNPAWVRLFDTSKLNEESKLSAIKNNPFVIQFFKNPTNEEQQLAVKSNPLTFRYIKKYDAQMLEDALFNDAIKSKEQAEAIWDIVKKRVNKFPDAIAQKLATDNRYNQFAKRDYGIVMTNQKTKKGLFGRSKQVGGDIKNYSKYNPLAKMRNKLDNTLGRKYDSLQDKDALENASIEDLKLELIRRNEKEEPSNELQLKLSKFSTDAIKRELNTRNPITTNDIKPKTKTTMTKDTKAKLARSLNRKESTDELYEYIYRSLKESTTMFLKRDD